jgi:hypothetical protein
MRAEKVRTLAEEAVDSTVQAMMLPIMFGTAEAQRESHRLE